MKTILLLILALLTMTNAQAQLCEHHFIREGLDSKDNLILMNASSTPQECMTRHKYFAKEPNQLNAHYPQHRVVKIVTEYRESDFSAVIQSEVTQKD